MLSQIIHNATTLFIIIDPIGLIPIFLILTRHEGENRPNIALKAVLVGGIILFIFLLGGQFFLEALEISLPAFRMSGGLILLIIGLKMVLEGEPEHPDSSEHPQKSPNQDVAVFPIAIPFIAGPGAIMSIIILTDNAKFTIPEQMVTAGVLVAVLVLTYIILAASELFQKVLGDTGINVITRLVGLLVAALGIQQIATGINNFLLH
jgi:multiple antibiotic resistance protein